MVVVKNGTRMMTHIADCKNCDEMVKVKYLKKDSEAGIQDVSDDAIVSAHLEEPRPGSSRQTSIDSLFRNQSGISSFDTGHSR